MRKTLFLMVLLVCNLLNAQERDKTSTLYKYGAPLITCETNFENLFKNVSKYIENDGSLDLLSCNYIGIVESAKHARKLVGKNFSHYPKWAVAESHQGYTLSGTEKKKTGVSRVSLEPVDKFPSFINVREAIKTISNEYIRPGDQIYLLRFVYNMETFEQYVFVHPDTKEVVTEGDVFGFKIRLSHFECCDDESEDELNR